MSPFKVGDYVKADGDNGLYKITELINQCPFDETWHVQLDIIVRGREDLTLSYIHDNFLKLADDPVFEVL